MMRHVNCWPTTPSEGSALTGRAVALHPIDTATRTTCNSSPA